MPRLSEAARPSRSSFVSTTSRRVVDRCEKLVRAVRRGVVDDDQLELGQRLPQDARDRLPEGRDGIVGREDDGDERRRGHCTPGSGR